MPNGSLHDVPSTPVRSPLRSRPTGILLVAVALCLLILGGGGFFLHHQIQGLRAREQNDLMAIADLKAGQISAWYANQRHQAERLFRNRLLRGPVTEVLGGKATVKTRADLQAWMNDFRMDGYSRILLLDRMGRICLQSPVGAPPAPDIRDRAFQTGLASSGVRIEDLHREPKAPGIHLNVWVPVTGSGGGPNEGVFLLQTDTARFLAPFIESWPEPSASAETQLVRRSGDSVEYLNDQRFRPHSALSLKIPLAEHPDHPAVLAAEGREGLVAGPDYRNVRVLAALRRIPGTPWSLVAKIDEAEIFRSARTEDWMGAFILIGLVVLVVTGAALIFREVQLKETRAHLRLEQEARIANDRYRSLLEQASDVILLLDLEGRILEANPRVLDQYGYTPEELVGTPGTRLRAPGSKESLAEDLDHLRAGEPMQYETLHCRRDGSVFPVEISTRMVHLDGQPCFLGFIRDITERKAQEREIQRMTRLYSALSQVNQAIVWSATREALLSKICEVMVEFGGFSLAWIGWDDPVTHRVSPVAHAGDRWDIMARVVVRSDDTPDGHGPLGTAIREGTAQLLNDYAAAPESKPWRTFLEASGLSSIAAFPIREGGQVVGGLAVYSTEKGFFGTHEMALLEEAAMDISFALDHLAGEAQRQMAEQALRESEAFLREAEEAGGVGCYTWDLLEDRWVSSEPLDRMFGIGPVHPRNLEGWMSLVVPSHREELKTYVAGLLGEGTRFDHEYPIQRPSDGALRWLHGTGALRRDASGQPAVLTGVIRDITDRKEREGELTRLTRLYAALSHVNQAIVRSRDRQELLDHICEAMVEQGRFTMAWVGWDDPVTHVVRVQARYGDVHGYLEGIQVRSDLTPTGQGPAGKAIREGVSVIVNDFLEFSATKPWHDAARRCGFAASASFPIREGGRVVAALMVYGSERGFFGEQETSLLEEAATDVSFALDHLAGEARRTVAEEALRRQKEEFETIFNRVPTQIWFKDTGNRFLRVNDKVCADLGFPRDQIEGHSAEELFPEFAAGYFQDDQEVFRTGQPKLGILEQIQTSEGKRLWLRTDKVPVLDAAGGPVGLLAIVEDLTPWKQVEETLHTVYAAMEQSPVSVVITDPRGIILYVNPAFIQTTGYTLEEALGQNPRVLKSGVHPPEFYREMWETVASGRVWSGEIQNKRKNGEVFTEMATISPIRDSSGAIIRYVAIKEDITERKRAEQERRELEAQIQQAQKLESLGSLAGGLAHDMNNVLGAILGLASMLREKSGETEGKALDTIVQACMRGRGVVKSLLYFARKDLQEERAIDLNALAEEMAQLLSHTTLKRVDLTLELQPSLPQIRGDGGALSHVLMNLCVNALDAMPAGGSLRIQTASLEKGGVELRVRDTGEGMTPEVLARCLEPFYTTKPRGKGTGLGLPMVHSTMVAHEGEFLLRSTPGEGTEAILRFPASRTLASAGPEAVEPVSPSAPSPSLDVLLVDDDDLVRESVTELIGLLGHRGVAVGGGQEALDRLERGQAVDLVILDMNMPGMSGAQVLPRLLALRPSLPVILATGYSHEDMTPLLIGRPNVRSLSKPFTALELKAKIDELDIHPSENRG